MKIKLKRFAGKSVNTGNDDDISAEIMLKDIRKYFKIRIPSSSVIFNKSNNCYELYLSGNNKWKIDYISLEVWRSSATLRSDDGYYFIKFDNKLLTNINNTKSSIKSIIHSK